MENFDIKWKIIYRLLDGPIIMANQLKGIIFFTYVCGYLYILCECTCPNQYQVVFYFLMSFC